MLRCYWEFLEYFPWKRSEFPTYDIWICSDADDARIFRQGWAARCRSAWMPIESAPKDGSEIIVYCPPAHGLNHMASVCAWHEDAGFCVDELREPTLWIPLPNDQMEARRK
jgi:hypothetical protein